MASSAASTSSSSSSSSSMKILTIGPTNGQMANLISKASAIQAKHGPFDALFAVGDFFHSADRLNEEEKSLLEGKTTLPIRTLVCQSRRRPPPEVREKIQSMQRVMAKRRQEEDQVPIKLAENLFWMGRDQVCWVSKDVSKDEEAAQSGGGDTIVDEEQIGLRVAVCGGRWDASRWAAEIQGKVDGVDGTANEDSSSSQQSEEDAAELLLPSSLERLYQHRSFTPRVLPGSETKAADPEPQTLAAARAKLQAEQSGSSNSSSSPEASIDLLILPTWPAGVSLFSKSFPPVGVPEEARTWGLPPVAEVMRRAKPRYAFAIAPEKGKGIASLPTGDTVDTSASVASVIPEWQQTGVFWEREPYSSAAALAPTSSNVRSGSNAVPIKTNPTRITRFISLADFANPKKVRWFLALNLPVGPSASSASAAQTVKGVTPSPFGSDVQSLGHVTSRNGSEQMKRKAEGGSAAHEGEGLQSSVNFRWQQGGQKKQRRTEGSSRDADGPPPPGYICVVCGSKEHYVRQCPHKHQRQQQQSIRSSSKGGVGSLALPNRPEGAEEALGPLLRRAPVQMVGPKDCWFCLSNEGCAKHLVVAIGEESYLALPKGQLPPSSSEASPVPGGGHVLIIPISHVPSVQSMDDSQARDRLAEEMEQYLSALARCYEAHGCILVAWSIVKLSNTRAGHMQIQAVPVPQSRVMAATASTPPTASADAPPQPSPQDFETYLRSQATQRGYRLEEVSDPPQKRIGSAKKEEEYLQLDIFPSSSQRIVYRLNLSSLSSLSSSSTAGGKDRRDALRFDYQFPRIVLASYLGVPDRADWRRCARSLKVEAVETRTFREAFAEWMPEFDDDDDDEEEEEEEEGAEE